MATGPREEPILTGGAKAFLAIVLVGAGVAGFFALDPEIDLDELTQETSTPSPAIPSPPEPPLPFDEAPIEVSTTRGLVSAVAAVRDRIGEGAELTRLLLSPPQFADFHIRRGEQVDGLRFDSVTRELSPLEVRLVGGGSLGPLAFPLVAVDPAAVDRIRGALRRRIGAPDFSLSGLDLRRDPVDGQLRWEITARGGGEIGLIFHADADGRNLRR